MINNTRFITAYDFEILEFVRTKLKEAVEQKKELLSHEENKN